MKKGLILMFVLITGMLSAQEMSKYEAGMTKALAKMKTDSTIADYTATSALFERIGDAEKDKWLPYYYAAYTNYMTGWMDEKADKDKIAEKSIQLIEKAEALEPKNAELFCMRNMVAVQQMMVDPSSRWMSYGRKASKALEQAKDVDPNNPRIYYLEAQSTFNTPEAFGGGKKAAKPKFEKAVEMYGTFKLPSPLHPDWGKEEASKMLEECNK